ncbi:MAG: type II toxin-antitoxin system HicA family toxin [Methylococcaceae bacterium]|jgi:hypothetical protein|nr:type II toxin-antitoxin system HicA family toxin [Methylococcaceae bacterium]MDZ4156943.1 type II toxin-antitoxin system HicA family toxin [Methylococcales bacterium]MDP2394009.1 type II toxin-antitoxin system HicA family toxin [Methylococcaceae bacterium]MDP3018527.1 type II toxin-antitoxin system HicA family toxin [Methylococcaceae bacterium]MDP3390947.1 type II toxin-antitoxin system HicA family toxin [Methylococcaceae bacterium]
MSKQQKALERLLAQPIPADITWDELKKVLEGFGYKELKNDGSRRKFFNKELEAVINLHKPHPGNIVKKVYIGQVIDHLTCKGLIDKK